MVCDMCQGLVSRIECLQVLNNKSEVQRKNAPTCSDLQVIGCLVMKAKNNKFGISLLIPIQGPTDASRHRRYGARRYNKN